MISKMRKGLSNPKESFFIEPETDPLPAKVRDLEERVEVLEDLLWEQLDEQ